MCKNQSLRLPAYDGAAGSTCLIKSVTIEDYSCAVTTITGRVCVCVCSNNFFLGEF